MNKEKGESHKIEELIETYKRQMKETTDIIQKTLLEEKINQLLKKKEDWESNKPVYDYFFETGEILYS